LVCDDAPAAAAAIAALPELRQLSLVQVFDQQDRYPFAAAQLPTSLTQGSLVKTGTGHADGQDGWIEQLSQLSSLVNLEHLSLSELSHECVPGGLPSQLVKLTCLHIEFWWEGDTAEQFHHLSALTALRDLSISFADMNRDMPEEHIAGIAHLAQLTSLELCAHHFYVGTDVTATWASLTALHSLSLSSCWMQPSALSTLTQLQSLTGHNVALWMEEISHELLMALARLTALTQLHYHIDCGTFHEELPPAPAAAFTALAASTHLRSLDVDFGSVSTPLDIELLSAGAVYPHLRTLHVAAIPPSLQLLQRVTSACPAVDSLEFVLRAPCEPTVCQPLLQLSAPTNLQVKIWGPPRDLFIPVVWDDADVAAAAAGLLDVAVQLTGLKGLAVKCNAWRSPFKEPQQAVLELTAQTALDPESLSLDAVHLKNKVGARHAGLQQRQQQQQQQQSPLPLHVNHTQMPSYWYYLATMHTAATFRGFES
jgi:hypothetical protein